MRAGWKLGKIGLLAAPALCLLAFFVLALPQMRPVVASGNMPTLATMQDVERAINVQVPVLIQFDAQWCGYCRALQPHLQKLRARHRPGDLHIYKIDVDASRELASAFGVQSLPTMFIVHKGQVVGFKRGGMNEKQLFDWVAGVQAEIKKG